MKDNYYDNNDAYLPAVTGEIVPQAPTKEITGAEAQLIAGGHQLANVALSGRSGHSGAQQQDTAITHSVGHLIAAAPVVASVLVTSTGLVLLGWLALSGPILAWIGVELAIVGTGSAVALIRSRRAGLEHTPAGVERHEIDARAEVAKYAVSRHCEMVERLKGVRE